MKERITITKKGNNVEIEIKSLVNESKQKLLLIWIILFSGCGLAIFSQFFYEYDKSIQLFFALYLAFWLYFEFKVIYAYRWRKSGVEKISINSLQIILIKEIGKRGITQTYHTSEISIFRLFDSTESAFIKSFNLSYWNINKYSLAFEYQNKTVPFGIDLDKNEAKKLIKEIEPFLKKN